MGTVSKSQAPRLGTQGHKEIKMINVTARLAAIKHHQPSGITWVKLIGEDEFYWILANHPDTPAGFVSISGLDNGSFRIVEKSVFEKMCGA